MGTELNSMFGHPPLLKVVPMDTTKNIHFSAKNEVPVDKGHNVSCTVRTNCHPPEQHSP